jgi:hypothetical protein
MSHDDFQFEPVRGLPAVLPEGERLLWQGSPAWTCLAIRAYHVRKVAVYFSLLILWRIWSGVNLGHSPASIALSCLFLVGLAATAMGLLCLLAYLTARATVYSITSRRVLLRHGVAVPLTMNLPFTAVESAGVAMFADGTGDVAIRADKNQRVGYLITWPHLRPGYLTRPQPAMRALTDAQTAAQVLATALADYAGVAAYAGGADTPMDEPGRGAAGAATAGASLPGKPPFAGELSPRTASAA